MRIPVLNAGVIGLGVGEQHIVGYEQDARCQVTALCDSDASKLEAISRKYPGRATYDDAKCLLERPDVGVVSVASYDNVHCEHILTALRQDKHVFVEKPVCLYQHELEQIIALLNQKTHLRLSSNLVLRRVERFQQLRQRIRTGEMGDVYYIEGDYDYGRLHKLTSGWRGQVPYYSAILGGAIHLIDLILYLTGQRVVEVSAYGNRMATRHSAYRHHDMVVVLLRFDNDMLAKVSANMASVTPHHHKLAVYGTRSSFHQAHGTTCYFHQSESHVTTELLPPGPLRPAKGGMLPSFVRCILDHAAPDVGEQEVMDAMTVALAADAALHLDKSLPVVYPDIAPRTQDNTDNE